MEEDVGGTGVANVQDSPAVGRSAGEGGEITREAAREEMRRVMGDPTHPQHAAFKRGLPSATEFVSRLYQRIPGGQEKIPIDDTGLLIVGEISQDELDSAEPVAEGTADREGAPGAFGPDGVFGEADTENLLRAEWGGAYETHVEAALDVAREMFTEQEDLFQKIVKSFESPGDEAAAIKLLDEIAQRGGS